MLLFVRVSDETKYVQPDAANFNSWRRHIRLVGDPPDNIVHAWEDVKVKVKIMVFGEAKGQD